MRLNELTSGQCVKIVDIFAEPKLKRRLYELGIIPNAVIELINVSPMSRAYLIKIQGAIFAIRSEIAHKIETINAVELNNEIINKLQC